MRFRPYLLCILCLKICICNCVVGACLYGLHAKEKKNDVFSFFGRYRWDFCCETPFYPPPPYPFTIFLIWLLLLIYCFKREIGGFFFLTQNEDFHPICQFSLPSLFALPTPFSLFSFFAIIVVYNRVIVVFFYTKWGFPTY